MVKKKGCVDSYSTAVQRQCVLYYTVLSACSPSLFLFFISRVLHERVCLVEDSSVFLNFLYFCCTSPHEYTTLGRTTVVMSVSYEKKIRSQIHVRVDIEGAVYCGVMLTLRGGAEDIERIASSRKRECGDRACCRHTRHGCFFSGYYVLRYYDSVEHIFLFRCDFFRFSFPSTNAYHRRMHAGGPLLFLAYTIASFSLQVSVVQRS